MQQADISGMRLGHRNMEKKRKRITILSFFFHPLPRLPSSPSVVPLQILSVSGAWVQQRERGADSSVNKYVGPF